MPSIKIIKGTVDRLAHPPKGQKLFMDEALKGFGVLVGTNTKTYVAQRDIGGRRCHRFLLRPGGRVSPDRIIATVISSSPEFLENADASQSLALGLPRVHRQLP